MLYSAFLLALVAVSVFSAPMFSSNNHASPGILYPKEYADRQLWRDSVPRIKEYIDFVDSYFESGELFEVEDSNIIKMARDSAKRVMKDVNTFWRKLSEEVVERGGLRARGSTWYDNWNAAVKQCGRLEEGPINDLAVIQEGIWLNMESDRWNNIFTWMEEKFPSTGPQPTEFQAPIGDFLSLAGTFATSHLTTAECKKIVIGWQSYTPEPEFFIGLDATYKDITTIFFNALEKQNL
ncbi:hypothetical protein FRB96_003952 [Tulasnella sp. 330]|nr:hypothetical protein FRB96_003952 [Tulasnella sp. 330]